jgi:hypothetical protein
MIRQGASVKAVQKQLGHATASVTLDTYGHLFLEPPRPIRTLGPQPSGDDPEGSPPVPHHPV